MSIKLRNLIISFLLLSLLGSCSVFRKGIKREKSYSDLHSVVNDHLEISEKKKYLLIEGASLEIKAENDLRLKLTVYASRDEMIFGSIRFLGFEIMRIMITSDSVKYINRTERSYLFESQDKMKSTLPDFVNFERLQNVIFSGFYDIPEGRMHPFYRNSIIEADTVYYTSNYKEGVYSLFQYKYPEMALMSFEYNDLPLAIRGNTEIFRENNEMRNCSGFLQKELLLIEYDLKIRDIKQKEYNKTDFRIGKNYRKISHIF